MRRKSSQKGNPIVSDFGVDRCTHMQNRGIYYRDPALFGGQEVVDRNVDRIAATFGVRRSCLNVVSESKARYKGQGTIV